MSCCLLESSIVFNGVVKARLSIALRGSTGEGIAMATEVTAVETGATRTTHRLRPRPSGLGHLILSKVATHLAMPISGVWRRVDYLGSGT